MARTHPSAERLEVQSRVNYFQDPRVQTLASPPPQRAARPRHVPDHKTSVVKQAETWRALLPCPVPWRAHSKIMVHPNTLRV